MPEFFGLCGRNNPRPCRLAWSSFYRNPRVGSYPSDLLPSQRVSFYCSSDGSYSFNPPVVSPGESFGLPLVGGFTIPGQFSGQSDVFTPDTRAVFSFCRTANRLNVAHILTQAEINSINVETGIGEIDVGEYVFDCVAVTDQIEVINTILTQQEIDEINGIESESDRAFRKLFEQDIPESRNRLSGVKPNKTGIEYRLDNGSPKSVAALETNGNGNFVGEGAANYRDGTSKTLLVNLKIITERLPLAPGDPTPPSGSLQAEARIPKAGDIVYLTYVAVIEHYIRYSINVKWAIYAASLPPQCYAFPTQVKVSAFRFFEWNSPAEPETSIVGWRVVETHNIPINFTAAMGIPGEAVLGDFVIGGGSGIQNVPYMPSNSTIDQINQYADNQSILPTYQVNLNQAAGDANYHLNASAEDSPNAYRRANWYSDGSYSTYQNWQDAQSTVYFNVHPKALQKRDVDKFGIERFLANDIQKDIKAGRLSFFPFMDDPNDNNPLDGSLEFLSSTNALFLPIQPETRWTTSNAEIDCATGGGVALFPGGQGGFNGTGDVFAVFGIASPLINEKFEKDTRLLVEIFATAGAASGPNTIAIQGTASGDKSVACISDRIKQNAFVCHADSENKLIFNSFDYGHLSDGLRDMQYRPDIPKTENAILPDQFESLLGYSNLLGDVPGFGPGKIISIAKFAKQEQFLYKTTSRELIQENIEENQIEEVTFSKEDEKITFSVGNFLNGAIEIEYEYSGIEIIPLTIIFKTGSEITGSVDSVSFSNNSNKLQINHYWMRGDTIEINGNVSDVIIKNITVTQLKNEVANDFLNETVSSSESDILSLDNLNFYSKSLLFESNIFSFGQDSNGRLYIYFEDKNNGISCVQSNDDGLTWIYYYGIVESISDIGAKAPFVINSYQQNKSFLFYLFNGKILCKSIPISSFLTRDAFLIERFEKDRFVLSENENELPTEKVGIFSEEGKSLRRRILSYSAAGDLTQSDFLLLTGRDIVNNTYSPQENRNIEKRLEDNSVESTVENVYKNPIAIGSSTAFTNKDIENIYFSAYRKTNGIMRLFFLNTISDVAGGGQQLQCNFSSDDGINWYDNWEWIENRYNRFRFDSTTSTSFIDRNSDGNPTIELDIVNPLESSQNAPFGINIHWSRLKKDKVNSESTNISDESKTIEIQSPYVFYHSFLQQVFLFYVYNGCLLCKIFDEACFEGEPTQSTISGLKGMAAIKNTIEKEIRSYFIDGNLSSPNIKEELHYYVNKDTNERQVEGNIIFTQQYSIDTFNDVRNISGQRVCAYKFGNCNVRVFYKLDINNQLKAATWNGTEWFVEEFLNTKQKETLIPEEIFNNIIDVTGGFGAAGYGPVRI